MIDHKRDSDTDHPSKKKRNQTDCQKSKCLYVHKTLMRTKNDVINQRDMPTFICKTCQNNFIDKNELMHHRKHDHSINILCKYFLTSKCIRSSNQEHYVGSDMTNSLCLVHNVANATPGVATSVSPLWNTNFPLLRAMSQSPMSGLQQQMMTMMQEQKLQQQKHQEQMRMMMSQMINMNI